MESHRNTVTFQRDCFANYLSDIQSKVDGFPKPYLYPDGNPIRPVVPVQTTINKVMVVGAFPSARFERRQGKLIPVGDNLGPFEPEHYFDGFETRVQESTESLYSEYFPQLGIERKDLWITDIVKVYLYPEKHLKNCRALFPYSRFVNTHGLFPKVAEASWTWFEKELSVCNPKLVITLGEIAARVIARARPLLDGEIRDLPHAPGCKVVHLAHPEIRRLNRDWDRKTSGQLRKLSRQLGKYL